MKTNIEDQERGKEKNQNHTEQSSTKIIESLLSDAKPEVRESMVNFANLCDLLGKFFYDRASGKNSIPDDAISNFIKKLEEGNNG